MFKRGQSMRRLQDQYAKLTPEQQRKMGYGTITKIPPASGTNAAATPAAKPKPKPVISKEQESKNDLQQMEITAEARATPEGNLRYRKEEQGLSGVRRALGRR